MEIKKLPNAEIHLPTLLYQAVPIAEATHNEETFLIVMGLDRDLVRQLKEYSLDESDTAIQEQTSDRKRFGEGSYEAWYAKNRVPIALVRAGTNTLAALLWFGPETFENAPPLEGKKEWHTLAYRSYAPYRGTGLMKDFARFALQTYRAFRPQVVLWAGIHADNAASAGLAGKLGFERFENTLGSPAQIIMVEKIP